MPIAPGTLVKGAAVLSFGQVAVYGLSFVRNLILARILTKADFGLAAALALTMSVLELVSKMAFGKQIVQDREGDEPRFQAVAHSVQVSTGLISAGLVIGGAFPMALAFGVPNLTWAFASLALVPLARGAMHLDLIRWHRQYLYGPRVLSEVLPQFLATAAAWPLAVWLADFRAVLWIMLGKELLTVAISHLLAKRPYRLAWEGKYVKRMLVFGWPLLLTGLMIFASQQGDKLIIGAAFSLAELASYSIAFSLSSIPFSIFGQVGSSLMLPTLARHQDERESFEAHYRRCLELSVMGALVLLGPVIVVGGPLVRLLYGAKYSGLGTLMIIFGAIATLRFFRWAPALAAMSQADTINQFTANVARALSLPFAILMVALGTRKVEVVAGCGLLGEALAILVSVLRVQKRQGISLAAHRKPVLFMVGWIAVAASVQQWLAEGAAVWLGFSAVLALWSVGAIVSFFLFPDLMAMYRQTFKDLRIRKLFACG